jgi:hypothetical protein
LKAAIEKVRQEYETAGAEERGQYEAKPEELNARLEESEGNKRALSMAQQTKKGHVYIISNIGSFGETCTRPG